MSFPEPAVWFVEQQKEISLVAGAVFGLLIGSFLNVIIVRLPKLLEKWERGDSDGASLQDAKWLLIAPPSHCPVCGYRLRWFENVPIVSYLALRGKCSACHAAISRRYPAVEALTGALALLSLWRFGFAFDALIAFGLGCLFVIIAFIDAKELVIPDVLTLPAVWLGLAFSAAGATIPAKSAIFGAICGYGALALINAIYMLLTRRQGIGRGDWKLAAVIGAWLGLSGLIGSLMVAFLLGSLVGLALLLVFSQGRRTMVPFGPYLACGGIIAMFFGNDLAQMYLGLIIGN